MFKIPKAYELIEAYNLKDIHSKGYLLSHKKSAARISLIENDDDNKVFYIGFRTPPEDSTGVAHILEHSVLCGSKKYPLKDPFVELAKGSMNTFLNAMTYPDKTVYPVASTNDKDFANLMDVYMDAVLNPRIYDEEKIFMQEGWHYEVDDAGELSLNGVVYSEMKGAFSSPDDVLDREVFSSLFPDTAYGVESGGDPECIPDLTYDAFKAFHQRYYHPSNAYIYLYGNCDMTERLTYLDEEYLSKYEKIDPQSAIAHQKPFKEPIEVEKKYPIPAEADTKDQTYLSLNFVTGSVLDPVLYQAMDILDYALLNAPGAPIRKALLDAGIGKDILGGYNSGILQPMFTITAKGANREDLGAFLDVIKITIEKEIENGLNEKSLLAGINSLQFSFREADFGGYPKGLVYGLIALDSWLYNDHHPFLHLDAIEILDALKDKIGTGYFEELINMYFLENEHASIVIVEPEPGLTAKRDEALNEKLKAYKASINEDEAQRIKEQTIALKAYQDEPTPPEDLAKIPLLSRSDLRKEILPLKNRLENIEDIPVLYHDIETNGIHYLNFLFDISDIKKEDLPTLSLVTRMLGLIDTMEHSYADYANEVNLVTGGIFTSVLMYTKEDGGIKPYVTLRAKFLEEHTKDALSLMTEMILFSKWKDKKRIKELLFQEISGFQMKMMSMGHGVAYLRALSACSASAAFTECATGISYYKFLKEFADAFDEKIDAFLADAKRLCNDIFSSKRLFVSSTGNQELTESLNRSIPEIKTLLSNADIGPMSEPFVLECGNEGFQTASQVQYVARGGNFKKAGFSYTGALAVLKTMMAYEYLWQNVRIKGGAYGCMNNYQRFGDVFFVSYRDPNLRATDEIFEQIPDYLESFSCDERDMTKYVIGTISSTDVPLTPSQEGERSLSMYLRELEPEVLQKARDEVLSCDVEAIRGMASLIKAVLDQKHRCVLGNEDVIKQDADLFDTMQVLD